MNLYLSLDLLPVALQAVFNGPENTSIKPVIIINLQNKAVYSGTIFNHIFKIKSVSIRIGKAIKNNKKNMSIILSATIVPNPLSKTTCEP
jgi:hypothetical protein